MREDSCASILQLDPNICCVTRSTHQILEIAQKRGYDGDKASDGGELNELQFRVTDLSGGYQYEVTGNQSCYQLVFHTNEDKLCVVVDNGQVDVVDLADRIATIMRKQQTVSELSHSEE